MPVIVRELVIKAVVNGEKKETPRQAQSSSATKKNVQAGLEEVIKLINNRNER